MRLLVPAGIGGILAGALSVLTGTQALTHCSPPTLSLSTRSLHEPEVLRDRHPSIPFHPLPSGCDDGRPDGVGTPMAVGRVRRRRHQGGRDRCHRRDELSAFSVHGHCRRLCLLPGDGRGCGGPLRGRRLQGLERIFRERVAAYHVPPFHLLVLGQLGSKERPVLLGGGHGGRLVVQRTEQGRRLQVLLPGL